jgi:predicted transcriptional regulator
LLSGAQVSLASDIHKEAAATRKRAITSGLSEMIDAAKSIFRSIFPDRIITLSDKDGKFFSLS